MEQLKKQGIALSLFSIPEEPTTDLALAAVEKARRDGCDFVIGIGGGSVLDTGKVVAALLTNSGELMNYLEVIGGSQPLNRRSAPYIAIPTTSGTGAEVTRNAVLDSPLHSIKVSMRSPFMLPRLALIDPELTYSMPPAITAATGLDAFTQLLEAFVSRLANPLTDCLCRQGLERAARALKKAVSKRQRCAGTRGYVPGKPFRRPGTGQRKVRSRTRIRRRIGRNVPRPPWRSVCRSFAPCDGRPISAPYIPGPQTLLHWTAMTSSPGLSPVIPGALADQGITWVQELCIQLNIPTLSAYGLRESGFSHCSDDISKCQQHEGQPDYTDKGGTIGDP